MLESVSVRPVLLSSYIEAEADEQIRNRKRICPLLLLNSSLRISLSSEKDLLNP